MAMTLMLANVEVVYSDVVVGLRGVSLTVPPGAIVALLGANGAGKTTCLRAISGLLDIHRGRITKGTITFEGERIDRADATQIVRRGVAQVLEGRRIFPELTVDENLRAGSFGRRDGASGRRPYDRVMALFPPLAERRGRIAGYLSGGEQQITSSSPRRPRRPDASSARPRRSSTRRAGSATRPRGSARSSAQRRSRRRSSPTCSRRSGS